MKLSLAAASAAGLSLALAVGAAAQEVNSLGPGSAFERTLTTAGGTAEIVSTVGAGGALENDAPLPGGALQLVTPNDNAARAEVARSGNFGTVADIFTGDLSFTYSWFNEVGSGTTAAPALKLAIFDPTFAGDGFGQLIYEPYAQGNGSNTIVIPEGQWVTETITLTQGLFWDTGLFGTSNQAGGPPYQTLQAYLTDPQINQAGFAAATLVSVSIGLGSFNPGVSAFVDDVRIAGTALDGSFDFEVATAIPIPAALPLFATALGILGFAARRKAARA